MRRISLYFPCRPGISPQRRVRPRLPPPPTSLRLQRLCTRYPRQSQKLPRFRGVLGEGHSRIRTGDGEFRADSGQLVAFISVAKFGGSDSLPIRPTGNTGGSNSIRSATQSAVAETSRPHPGTAREIPAIARGFGRRALAYPNRRLRVAGLEVAAARVFLCCQVGRFGFAPDSPQRSFVDWPARTDGGRDREGKKPSNFETDRC